MKNAIQCKEKNLYSAEISSVIQIEQIKLDPTVRMNQTFSRSLAMPPIFFIGRFLKTRLDCSLSESKQQCMSCSLYNYTSESPHTYYIVHSRNIHYYYPENLPCKKKFMCSVCSNDFLLSRNYLDFYTYLFPRHFLKAIRHKVWVIWHTG